MRGNETSPLETNGSDPTAADDSGFVWADERLAAASREELVDHVADLQDRMQSYEAELADVRATLEFLLDARAGFVDVEDAVETLTHRRDP